jgi:hypothetical protein
MGGMLGFLYHQLTFTPKPLSSSIDLTGQTALITGGNVGLGLEAAKQLVDRRLSRLILGVRTISKGEAARDEIRRQSPDCQVDVWPLDMESFESMRAFGQRIKSLDRLDIVILSAGIKLLEYTRAPTGHEAHVQVSSPRPIHRVPLPSALPLSRPSDAPLLSPKPKYTRLTTSPPRSSPSSSSQPCARQRTTTPSPRA